jgi:membrane protease YdiL (CAAX protease family)
MSGPPTRARSALPVPAVWRDFARFLRRPELPPRADVSLGAGVRALPALFALDVLLMAAVLVAIGLAVALGFELPEHMLGEMQITPTLIAFIVIGAPLGEEILFRGWLSGRPGHILAVLALLAGAVAVIAGAGGTLSLLGAIGLLVAVGALFLFRRRDALEWFRRHFAWLFYASAVVFAAVHLSNFSLAGGSPALAALVVPQFLLALILGYLRVSQGLLAAAALHMLHNAVFASVMVAGGGGG